MAETLIKNIVKEVAMFVRGDFPKNGDVLKQMDPCGIAGDLSLIIKMIYYLYIKRFFLSK